MTGPLDGVKVVELGLWLAGPACGAILADWGADVVKIEPLAGDPFRGYIHMFGGEINPPFELDNRGKRSISADLRSDDGRQIALDLLADADVFVTNYRPGGLDRLGLDRESVHAHNPRCVYLSLTGYGLDGPERDRAAYDMGAFWARAGVGGVTHPGGAVPAVSARGYGRPYDRAGGGRGSGGRPLPARPNRRGHTGRDIDASPRYVPDGQRPERQCPTGNRDEGHPDPSGRKPLAHWLSGVRWQIVWLLCLEGDRHWPMVLAALDRPELGDDPRFPSIEGRTENAAFVCAELQEIFRQYTRDDWGEISTGKGCGGPGSSTSMSWLKMSRPSPPADLLSSRWPTARRP